MAGASNYNANKYLNTEGNQNKFTLTEEKKKQFQQEYLKEFNDEMRAKNWNMNQTRMSLNLNELINTLAHRSSQAIGLVDDEDDEIQNANNYSHDIIDLLTEREDINKANISTLDQNSSTDEFRKYLEELKKNYLEKLTLTKEKKSNEEEKLKTVENVMNLVKKVKIVDTNVDETNKSNLHRSDSNLDDDLDESPELTSGQILSRLMQIREYLKQAYTMLSSLQDSNDLANYASQMNKLHSLIDHLKDQEKGYMDLLESFSKYQQLTRGLYDVNTLSSKPNPLGQFQKNILDLSELNDSVLLQQKKQQIQQNELSKKKKSLDVTNSITNEYQSNSYAGSFISDTLTLNEVNGDFDEIVKYKSNTKSNVNEDLMIIGKALLKNRDKEESEDNEDAKTDNDQEVLEFDDDYYNEIEENDGEDVETDKMMNENVSIKEQRKEILNEIDNDLTTLEQLREQKKLLRSIRLRKEELKALEGRRKALEALKTIALDGENQLVQAFDVLTKSKIQDEEKSNLDLNPSNLTVKQTEDVVKKEHQPLLRKTFKQNESDDIPTVKSSLNQNISTKIEPSSQIEKSKKTVKHYEDLIRKNINLANESYKSKAIMNIDKIDESFNDADELEEKKTSLAENERKLKELYSMQERLSQLKEIINHFNGLKQTQGELTQIKEESDPIKSLVSAQTKSQAGKFDKSEQNLGEKTILLSEKINMDLESRQKKAKSLNTIGDKKDLSQSKISNVKKSLEKSHSNEELSDGDDELIEEHKRKLTNAKEKLKQLQDLIVKLQVVSGPNPAESLPGLTSKQIHETQQKEASKALNVLNQLEKQKTEEKLNELKQNKEKLLKLLKEKEKESELLTKLYSSHSNQHLNTSNSSKKMEELNKFKNTLLNSTNPSGDIEIECSMNKSTSLPMGNDYEIEDKFESAESDFNDAISIENTHLNQCSPSDLLWTQMKKQLNMRENLRNKKKELEDLIRDVNTNPSQSVKNQNHTLESKEKIPKPLKAKVFDKKDFDDEYSIDQYSNNDDEGHAENNEIINGYREFFMRKKSAFSSDDSYEKEFLNRLKSIKLNASKIESEAEENTEQEDEDDIKDENYSDDDDQEEKDDNEEQDIIMKRFKPEMILPKEKKIASASFKKQQENILSADELIKKSIKYKEKNDDQNENEESEDEEIGFLSERFDETKTDGELLRVFPKYGFESLGEENFNSRKSCETSLEKIKSSKLLGSKEVQEDSAFLNKLDARFGEMLASQQKFNETIQKSFTDVVNTLSRNGGNLECTNNQQQQQHQNMNYSPSSQFQFQTQVQVQQMMFNLNTAYHEISMQKNEITYLNEQIKTINAKLTDLSKPITTLQNQQNEIHLAKTERVNHQGSSSTGRPNEHNKKEREQYDAEYNLNNTVISNNALPSYFYNQKMSANTQTDHASARHHEAYYTDDFEEFEDDEEHEHNKINRNNSNGSSAKLIKKTQLLGKKPRRSSSSSSTSSTSVDSSKSESSKSSSKSVTTSSSSSSSNDSSTRSEASSTLALRKSSFSNTYEINSEASQMSNAYEFDKMREKIYSEVATLISQNEKFPKYLLNLFKELQYLKTEKQRDQALKSIFNISNRRELESSKKVMKGFFAHNKYNLEVSDYKRSKQNQVINHATQIQSKRSGNPYKSNTKYLDDMLNSFSSIKKLKPTYKYSTNKEFDDDDDDDDADVITSTSGLRNTNKSNKNVTSVSTHTDSDFDKKYFRSLESNNDEELDLNPFEKDSLSNTVIFVKNAATAKNQHSKLQTLNPNSGLSLLDAQVHSTINSVEKQSKDENNIGDEVKNLISKIITSIKASDDFSDDDDDNDEEDENRKKNSKYTSDPKYNYKYARCDLVYLNEIIDKVLNVLKSSNKYSDYLKLYQNQLSSYLKNALQKYQNQRLVCVMEEILIEISDILCNELTFYTIMNKSRIIKSNISNNNYSCIESLKQFDHSSVTSLSQSENYSDKNEMNLNLVKSLARGFTQKKNEDNTKEENSTKENYKRSWSNQANESRNSWSTTSENDCDDDGDTSSGTGEKVYFFDGDSFKSKLENIESNLNSNTKAQLGINLLNRLKFLFKDRFNSSSEVNTSNSKDIKLFEDLQLDDLNSDKIKPIDKENNGFELKLIKYLSESNENKIDGDESTEESECTESETDNVSIQTQASIQKEEVQNDLHYKVVDINDIIETSDSKIIEKNKVEENIVVEQSSTDLTVEKDLLDNIIMDSIEDGLVGDANALPLPINSQKIDQNSELLLANQMRESINDNQSQNSESSNSNSEFVYINTASSSDSSSVVEIKKSSLELDNQEKVLVNHENGSPQENLESEENSDELEKQS